MNQIIAVMVPRCSSAASLARLPAIVDEHSLALARAILERAFRCHWPHRN